LTTETTITVTVDPHIKAQADKLAKAAGIDLNQLIVRFLTEFIASEKFPSEIAKSSEFPEIWHDNPANVATFNQHIGHADDGQDQGNEYLE